MTALDTARAIALIDAELKRAGVPGPAREDLAPSILGALTGRFAFIPNVADLTADEEAQTRLDLAAIDIPGFHDFITPRKGRT